MLDFLRIGRGDGEKLAVWQGGSFRVPPLMTVHCLPPGGTGALTKIRLALPASRCEDRNGSSISISPVCYKPPTLSLANVTLAS